MTTFMRTALRAGAWIAALGTAPSVQAGSHLWRFNEIFTNADGSIQFIELKECCGAPNETYIVEKWVRSDATGMQYEFPNSLECQDCTANKYLLLATQSFADLPGAPKPDFIIPPHFFSKDGDTLDYWFYAKAQWTFGGGLVPTDGTHSFNSDGTTGVNSPTNFAGDTGSVVVGCPPADINDDGAVNVSDLLSVIASWGPCADPNDCPADIAPSGGNDVVNVSDLLGVIAAWGPCP